MPKNYPKPPGYIPTPDPDGPSLSDVRREVDSVTRSEISKLSGIYEVKPTGSGSSSTVHRGDGTWAYGPIAVTARVRPSAATQSIGSGGAVNVTFGTTEFDYGGLTGVTANALVVPAGRAGLWQVLFCANFAGNATGVRNVQIRVNGSTVVDVGQNGSASGNRVQATTTLVLAAGDTLTASVYQDSGAALNLNNTAAKDTWLAANFEGPTA